MGVQKQPVDSQAAASARVSSAGERLGALRERARLLRDGVPVRVEDVARARRWAEQQRVATRDARERLTSTHLAAANRHNSTADLLAASGRDESAERFRQSARRHQLAAWESLSGNESVGLPPAVHAHAVRRIGGSPVFEPADRRAADEPVTGKSPEGSAGRQLSAANRRLRDMVAALAGSRRRVPGRDRVRALWETLAARCSSATWRGWAQALCEVGTQRLPSVSGTAITAYDATGQEPVAASDAWTESVEEVQQLLGEGPSLSAYRTGRMVCIADLDQAGSRWPVYVSQVAGHDVRSVWAFPLQLGSATLGVITFYRTTTAPPAGPEWSEAIAIADAAVTALIGDAEALEQFRLPGATGSMLMIHVATGILASRLKISPEEALLRLRAHAFSSNERLGSVAEQVVHGRLTTL